LLSPSFFFLLFLLLPLSPSFSSSFSSSLLFLLSCHTFSLHLSLSPAFSSSLFLPSPFFFQHSLPLLIL
jgi:hypothetical protein